MSLKKLALVVGTVALVAAAQLGSAPSANACINITVWGTNPSTGECRQFGSPCSVPRGWTVSYTPCAS